MSKRVLVAGVVAACLLGSTDVGGQRATEIYIPIGSSPGLSGSKTSLGTIQQVDAAANEIVVTDGSATRTVRCNDLTKIWLDRSAERLQNRVGTLADCRPASKVEIKYVDNDKAAGVAEWVKVAVTGSD